MSSAAVTTLKRRAEQVRESLQDERSSKAAHERGALQAAQRTLRDQEAVAAQKQERISALERELAELNAGIHQLNGTRPIRDSPQA